MKLALLAALLVLAVITAIPARAEFVYSPSTRIPWCYKGSLRYKTEGFILSSHFWEQQAQGRPVSGLSREDYWESEISVAAQWEAARMGQGEQPVQKSDPCAGRASSSRAKAGRVGKKDLEERRRREKETGEARKAAESRDRAARAALERMYAGNLFSAESALDALIAEFPAVPGYHRARAALMTLLGRAADSETSRSRALELDEDGAKSAGFLCRKLKDACLAISDGLIREALGNTAGALESYTESIGVDPKNWLAYAYRGILRIQTEDCVRGVLDLQRASLLNPAYKVHAAYYLRQCPQPEAEPAGLPAATPGNPFPERAEDQKVSTTPP